MVCASDDGPGTQLHQSRHHVVVERTRIHLPDAGQNGCEAEEISDEAFQLGQLRRVAAEQVEHVLGGSHRTFDAAQRVTIDQLPQPGQRDQSLLRRRREPLAQCGGLRRDVVTASGHHQIAVGRRTLSHPGHHGHAVREHQLQRTANL